MVSIALEQRTYFARRTSTYSYEPKHIDMNMSEVRVELLLRDYVYTRMIFCGYCLFVLRCMNRMTFCFGFRVRRPNRSVPSILPLVKLLSSANSAAGLLQTLSPESSMF